MTRNQVLAVLFVGLSWSMVGRAAAQDLPNPFETAPAPAEAPAAPPDTPAVPTKAAPKTTQNAAARKLSPRFHLTNRRNISVPARLKAKKVVRQPVDQLKVAEKAGYKKVSDLVNFPAFFPGLGIVTVKPDTLPVGPFRTFDRKGKLIATVYMLPLKDMVDHKKWDEVKGLPAPADHATFYFHPGHPGVDIPHYHLVIWHVNRKNESLVAQ